MDIIWDIFMRPVIEAVDANYIVELGLDTGLNTGNILEYCDENNAHLTTVAPFSSLYINDYQTEYGNKFELYTEKGLERLPLLENYDVCVIEFDKNFSNLYSELKTIEETSTNKKFPIIFLLDLGLYFPNKNSGIDYTSENSELNKVEEEDIFTTVKNFMVESDLTLSFKMDYSNSVGVLSLNDEELDNILNKQMESFDQFKTLYDERIILSEDLENYQKEVTDLEKKLAWNENEYLFKSNIYRSPIHRIMSKFPMIYMIPHMPRIGIKNTLINRKGLKAIKKYDLFNVGYYLTRNPDIKRKGQDPILHYIYHGYSEGRTPNPEFDGDLYLEKHPDIRDTNLNPLVHYALYGINEQRETSQNFYDEKQKSVQIRGEMRFDKAKLAVEGFLIARGDNNSMDANLKIDNQNFKVECNVNPAQIEKNNVKDVRYYFKFKIPPKFIDGKDHGVIFSEKNTGNIISKKIFEFPQLREFYNFSGFLANSIVSPVINAPFREEDKRCFATMENVAKYLSEKALNEGKSLVSVIMPVHNRIDTVMDAVDSVLKQTYTNIELLIVDDGSKDGSKELLEQLSDERIVLLHHEKCKGVSAARNTGLEAATGEYITYLDSDNLWDSRYVAAMLGAFLVLPDADAVYGGQLLYNADDQEPFAVRFGSFNRSLLTNRNYIDLNVFGHTNEVYKRTGGFDVTLNRLVDYDLIMRMAENSQIYSIPVLLSHYYYDNAQNTITKTSGFTELLETVRSKRMKRLEDLNQKADALKDKSTPSHNVSVIIPSFEALEDISECIDSLLSLNATKWMEIIVVDNKSGQNVINYLKKLEIDKKIKLVINDINYGFTYAVNQGIEAAEKGNDILIMNNDAMITPGAIESLQTVAYQLPECGITVPQQVLPGGTKTINAHVPHAYPHYECDVNLSAAHKNIINIPIFHNGRVVELNFAPFFCVYIKREAIDNSVGLDAEYGRHYRSDRIFCSYIRHVMNLKIYYVEEAIVYHKLQKSTEVLSNEPKRNSDFDLMFRKNQWDPELAAELGYKTPPWDI